MAKEKKDNEENTEEDISKRLDELTKSLDKKYGKGAVSKGGDIQSIPRWHIESPNISYVLGGGLPKGIIMEVIGVESGGKTSLSSFIGAQVQKQGGKVAVIDAENSFDLDYAEEAFGLKKDEVFFNQPESGEQGLGIAEDLAKSGVIDYIIVDSVAALTPQAEIEGEMGDQQMGLQARLMGKALRKMGSILKQNNCTICFINQIRENIGTFSYNKETTPGGKALKFYSSIRLDIRRIETLMEGQKPIGIKTRIKGIKNKTAPPFRRCEEELYFNKGFQYEAEYVDFAVHFGFIEKSASWFVLRDDNGEQIEKLQGKEKVVNYLKENPELYESIKEKVDKALLGKDKEIEVEQEGNTETTEQENT